MPRTERDDPQYMNPKPLVDDRKLREQLAELERVGAVLAAAESVVVLPPSSARREAEYEPITDEERERLKVVVRKFGLELINDGACYRCKRQRDFMIWTLTASPLLPETSGGGEANALMEMVRRFCEAA